MKDNPGELMGCCPLLFPKGTFLNSSLCGHILAGSSSSSPKSKSLKPMAAPQIVVQSQKSASAPRLGFSERHKQR